MRLKSSLAALLSLLALACGGGGGGSSSGGGVPALTAPSALTITTSSTAQLTLTWTQPATLFDGYELEGKIGDGAFAKVHTGLIPANYTGIYLTISSTAPDNVDYVFRIRAARGSEFSAYSNLATHSRGPNAPGQATATYDWSGSAVVLGWDRNTVGSDGLQIERAECTSYGSLSGGWIRLPVSDSLTSSYRDTGISPNLYYTYRIINLRGPQASQPSQVSQPVFTGLASASWLNAYYDSTQAGMAVTWGSLTSGPAEAVRLERSDSDISSSSQGNWAIVSMPSGFRTSFLDQGVVEGGRYFYRVTYLYGATATTPYTLPYSVSVPLLTPINLKVTATISGLQLTWENRSRGASQVVIRRTPYSGTTSDIAILSPSTSSYLDPATSLGYYTYTVVAKNSAQEASSAPVSAATLNPPGALALTATALNLPLAADAAIRPSGTWAFATTSPFGILSNGDPWAAYFPGNATRWTSTILKVDFQGRPHAVYAAPNTGGAAGSTLLHAWYDGTSWKSESVATMQIPNSSANQGWVFQLDTTGTPHIILDHQTANQPSGGATSSLSYLHKVGGTWVEEPLSSLSPGSSNIGTFHLILDGSDTPHLLLGNWSTIVDYARTGAGTWAASTLPVTGMNAGWYDFLDGIWVDSNNGWVFYEAYVNGNILEHGLWALQMKGGAWKAPVLLGSRVHDGASTTAMPVISPDKTRVAILFNTSAGVKCYHLSQDAWQETLVAPYASSYPWLRSGFDGSQKLHILSSTGTGYVDYHE
jgi:hypothetical protein